MALLEVKNMNISVSVEDEKKSLVRNVSFSLEQSEILGLVGASGSGKSLTVMSITGLLPEDYNVSYDSIRFNGNEIDLKNNKSLPKIRGAEIAYVFQEPMTSLNPLLKIKKQVEEPLIIHKKIKLTKRERELRVKQALLSAGLDPTVSLLNSYPHELSGGQRQRVMIAMAFVTNPKILVADEITTALDTENTEIIAKLLLERRARHGTSIIFISHDRRLVEKVSDRIICMHHGEIVGESNEIFDFPDYKTGEVSAEPILRVRDLSFSYKNKNLFGKEKEVPVLQDINFDLYKSETLGIVGRSGAGKSTLVKVIAGMLQKSSGTIMFDKQYENIRMVFQDPYTSLNKAKSVGKILREAWYLNYFNERRKEKSVGQNTAKIGNLNKIVTVNNSKIPQKTRIGKYYGLRRAANIAVFEALKSVDLKSEMAYRMLYELSGGERQRVAIACAVISSPGIIILDEPVSAVDFNVAAQILELLQRLKEKTHCSYIFISHDKEVIKQTCQRVLILDNGTVKESK